MGATASIIFKTEMDKSGLIKDLNNVKKDIERNNKEISKNEQAKIPFAKQLEELTPKLDAAKQKLHSLRVEQEGIAKAMLPGADPQAFIEASAKKKGVEADIKAQEKEVSKLQKTWDGVSQKVENYDSKIKSSTEALQASKNRAGVLEAQLSRGGNGMAVAMQKAEKSAHAFQKRIITLGKRILVFSLVANAFRAIRDYTGRLLSTNQEYIAQLAKLKGALMTAFQPLYEAAIPGLMWVLKLLTQIVQIAASLISALFGKSAKQSADNAAALNKEANAIKGVGGAAKKAQKDLAGFDQINRLSSPNTGGGGGGGGAASPDFSAFDGMDDDIDKLRKIAKLVLAIGAGLIGWKIARGFTDSLKAAAGIFFAVAGAVMFLFSWFDAFQNGIDWENLTGMIVGLSAAVFGLWLAFGPIGAAIGLIVGGIAMIVVAAKEWYETGELSNQAALTILGGLLAVGGGISLLTGSFIPLLVAAVIGLVVLVVGKGQEMKAGLEELDSWLTGKLTQDWTKTFGHVLGGAMNTFSGFAVDRVHALKEMLSGLIDFIQGVFTGNWEQAWEGIKTIFSGIWSSLVSFVRSPINRIIGAINAMISGVVSGINAVSASLNTLSFDIPSWVPKYGGQSFGLNLPTITSYPQIPLLAKGAVLPPNRPFMAMVGDQTHGTNIEAPLDTIKQAVAEVIGAADPRIITLLQVIADRSGVYLDGEKISRTVSRYQREAERVGG